MKEQTEVNILYALILASLIGYTFLGPVDDFGTPLQKPTHTCEDRMVSYHCQDFSRYYQLPTGKCLNNITGNKLCKTGWEVISEIITEKIEEKRISSTTETHCTSQGCKS